jgi:hypothetical protein
MKTLNDLTREELQQIVSNFSGFVRRMTEKDAYLSLELLKPCDVFEAWAVTIQCICEGHLWGRKLLLSPMVSDATIPADGIIPDDKEICARCKMMRDL